MVYSVTLYVNRFVGPDKAARVVIVGVSPSRVMVTLSGSFDCTTKILIPDPDTTMSRDYQ
jgi:hypothetical protein